MSSTLLDAILAAGQKGVTVSFSVEESCLHVRAHKIIDHSVFIDSRTHTPETLKAERTPQGTLVQDILSMMRGMPE